MKNWNAILRWTHFLAGMVISFYFLAMPAGGWSDGFNDVMKFGVTGFVFWTGVIKWQLPRLRRWSRRRAAARAEA